MEQRSEEWYAIKAGKFSASEMSDVVAKPTTAAYRNLIAAKVAERLTGQFRQSFTSTAMQWGIDHENDARDMYWLRECPVIEETGFVLHPELPEWAGASPDGMVEQDGLVEIKCPNTATHIDYLRIRGDVKKIPKPYLYQMQWQMACTGRKWCDFVSYDPRMPDHLRLAVCRVERDAKLIEDLTDAVKKAAHEVRGIIEELEEVT